MPHEIGQSWRCPPVARSAAVAWQWRCVDDPLSVSEPLVVAMGSDMTAISDYSGEVLDGDAEAVIEIKLDDGRRRRLRLKRSEAESLATKGQNIGTRGDVW